MVDSTEAFGELLTKPIHDDLWLNNILWVRPLTMLELADGVLTSAERERLDCLGRATVLDWVIDPLSDWIDAGTAPEHERDVRLEKERIHRMALACYKDLYG